MKKNITAQFVFSCLLISFLSCEKKDYVLESHLYSIMPSEFIMENLFCSAHHIPETEYDSRNYSCYDDVFLSFSPVFDYTAFMSGNYRNEQLYAFRSWEIETLRGKCEDNGLRMRYSTSFLSKRISIYADVSLFGEEPGTNISSHFMVTENPLIFFCHRGALLYSNKYDLVYPSLIENRPTEIDDYFFDGMVLNNFSQQSGMLAYCICFKDTPLSQHEDLTIHIEIPVNEELRYFAYDEKGVFHPDKVKYRNRLLKGSVLLHFSK